VANRADNLTLLPELEDLALQKRRLRGIGFITGERVRRQHNTIEPGRVNVGIGDGMLVRLVLKHAFVGREGLGAGSQRPENWTFGRRWSCRGDLAAFGGKGYLPPAPGARPARA